MARIVLLFHPPGSRLFAVRDGKAIAYEVRNLRLVAENLERGEADHLVAEVDGEERPESELPLLRHCDLHPTAEAAIDAHAAYADGRMERPRAETQASTTEWTDRCYGHETGDRRQKILNLIEEVAELATEGGIAPEEAAEHFRRSAARPPAEGDRDAAVAGEIGDVGIAFYDVAEAFGIDADGCRDRKMAVNRTRSPEACAAREAAKRDKGL